MSLAAALATRVSGVVAALGYLAGIVEGPVVAVIGALALITFGRALTTRAEGVPLLGGAFAVLAGASGVVALRWGTLELSELRGIQGVLGPTFLVEPLELGIATSAAVVGGIGALGVWLAEPTSGGDKGRMWHWAEPATIALSLTALFAGPQVTGIREALVWVVGVVAIAGMGEALGRLLMSRALPVRAAVLGGAGALTLLGAGLVGALG